MDAKNYRLQQLFSGTQQFVIPIYQRQYSWTRRDWQALWDDIVEVYDEGGEDVHFLGSIVSKPHTAAAGGISSFVVIDGQQRLTTLTLLLAALRDAFADGERTSTTANKIQDLYLTNQYGEGTERYKVVPTRADQPQYFRLVDRKPPVDLDPDPVGDAYRFFARVLRSTDSSGDVFDLVRLEKIILGRFEVVSITLGAEDNDYRVFESLNARGRPLSQTDLLRNYFLMRFDGDKQAEIYNDYFVPISKELDASPRARSDTMFQYALQRHGVYVRDRDIYFQWKRRCDDLSLDALRATIDEIAFDCANYLKLLYPDREPNEQVRTALQSFSRLGIITPAPFLLNAYRWYLNDPSAGPTGHVSSTGFATILGYIESYLVRRLIAGIPANALNRTFIRLSDQLDPDIDLVVATHRALSQPGLRWPGDAEFTQKFVTYGLYQDTRPDQRRHILERLEASFGHKESPDPATATIEHVMPQTLTDEWRAELGPQAVEDHARLLHTAGNLTLTGYNSELSNDSFAKKREQLAESNFALSRDIASAERWDVTAIRKRSALLAERARVIWTGPSVD